MSDFWLDPLSTSILYVCQQWRPCETARMRRLTWAFAGRLCDKYHNELAFSHRSFLYLYRLQLGPEDSCWLWSRVLALDDLRLSHNVVNCQVMLFNQLLWYVHDLAVMDRCYDDRVLVDGTHRCHHGPLQVSKPLSLTNPQAYLTDETHV